MKFKSILSALAFILLLGLSMSATECSVQSSRATVEQAAEVSAQKANATSAVPIVSYFQERRTIKKFVEYYDRPAVATYVYLYAFGQPIGYFVADGKPASIRSYLTPEDDTINHLDWGMTVQAQALDGTYGEDNPGIRFFTASGIPVEFGGTGISYLYSPVPLAMVVPQLYREPPKQK